ncbi:MAG: helix-turn-helix domain-containing protein, partial [Alphaproteobacteria bacterium]|nr:helix-turn-helix domain-containing protein [Alphaproteobacteria bacterium]
TLAPGTLVVRALSMMESRLAEPDPIAAIADELGVSLRALERRFKSELGEPPSRYYRRLRVEHAARLVQQTEMTLTDIGVACGFASRAHFSRSYRAVVGRTPSADRERVHRRPAGRALPSPSKRGTGAA